MNGVRSGFGDDVNRSSRVSAARGFLGAGRYFEFLQGIGKWIGHVGAHVRIDMRSAVQIMLDAPTHPAGDGNVHAGIHGVAGRGAGLNGETGNAHQVRRLAAV